MQIDTCTYCGHYFVPSKDFRFFCTSLCWHLYYDHKEKHSQCKTRRRCAPTAEIESVGERPALPSCVIIKSSWPL